MNICKKTTTCRWQKPQSNDKLYKKQCIPAITENKKHLLKQVAAITGEREFLLQLLFLNIRQLFFFSDRVKRFVVYFGLYEPYLHFKRRNTK